MADLKNTIILESLKLFSLKGFLGASIQDIITAAQTSKGGFYNHFSSKEDLFFHVLETARSIWRERNLDGIDNFDDPIDKIIRLLLNYKDRYLLDSENFLGGCIFIMFAVELGDNQPNLAKEVQKGFTGLKAMLKRILENGKSSPNSYKGTSTEVITEIIFNGMLGASVNYSVNKSSSSLNRSIRALIDYLNELRK